MCWAIKAHLFRGLAWAIPAGMTADELTWLISFAILSPLMVICIRWGMTFIRQIGLLIRYWIRHCLTLSRAMPGVSSLTRSLELDGKLPQMIVLIICPFRGF
jgi:hypothetical protein